MRGFATTPHPKAAAATVGEISAARISHTENAWLFTRTTEPRRLVGGTACEVIGSREYEAYEIVKLVEWLADRKAGYPSLMKFEHGANWPHFPYPTDRAKCSGCEGATWGHRNGVANGYA